MLRLSDLNPEQRAATTHKEGPLLILAGAGSGKTRVIVHRIVYLLQEGIAPENILAVSFTNRAVKEMEERVASMLRDKETAKKLTLSTFHSLGVRMLRNDIDLLQYPKRFTIYDPGDQLAMIKRVMRDLRIDDKRYDAKQFQAAISQAKNFFQEPNTIRDPMMRHIYKGYDEGMRVCGAVDFDDLIRLPVRLLREFPQVRHYWADRFHQIMVDEYQDTNEAQLLMVKELASIHNNLCVVGDDDQSIYGWRGSNVENIRQFDKQFPGTRIVKLTQNYRCSGNILNAANRVIERGVGRYHKELWTDQGDGARVQIAVLEDEEEEARFVIDHLRTLQYEEKRKWADFSIMYRTNAQSRAFEELLRSERMPYRMVGGTKFFERKEVRDLLAYLKVIQQPNDEISLRRIINYPPRKIGNTTIDRMSQYAKKHGIDFYKAGLQVDEIEAIKKAQKRPVSDFFAQIEEYRSLVETQTPLSVLLHQLVQDIKIQNTLYKEYNNLSEAKRRIENVDALLNSVLQYEARIPHPSLEDYLDRVSLDTGGESKTEKEEENAITLITLHGAKGLEYPVVYLVGMEEGFLPYFRRTEEDSDIEEERRLCYVGITRAKQRLILSRVLGRRRFGRFEDRIPSRFLQDIPKGLLEEVGPEQNNPQQTEEERDAKFRSFFGNIFDMLEK